MSTNASNVTVYSRGRLVGLVDANGEQSFTADMHIEEPTVKAVELNVPRGCVVIYTGTPDPSHRSCLFVRPRHYRDVVLQLRTAADELDAAADRYEHAQDATAETVPTVEAGDHTAGNEVPQ